VPKKEGFIFVGWLAAMWHYTYCPIEYPDWKWSQYTALTLITDEDGNLTIGYDVFNAVSNNVYAFWRPIEPMVYKILLVFVTEIQAEIDGFIIDYKMTDIHRQFHELIAPQMERILNDWLNGIIEFQVDAFFTTKTVGAESFERTITFGGKPVYHIFGYMIPEVLEISKNYLSVITLYML
jgi:hypothetical protein